MLFRWFCILLAFCCVPSADCSADSRPAAVAGKFYPEDPSQLSATIDAMMREAVSAEMEPPIALVVPHAGYVYSGRICADAFKLASRFSFDRIIILGTNHTTPDFQGISIFETGEFETPLGRIPIDEEIAKKLLATGKPVTADRRVHRLEHSIEVILPFIQKVFPKAKIVPVIIGEPNIDICQRFGGILAEAIKGKNALIIASSDLSHYPSYSDATEVDRRTLNAMTRLDPGAFLAEVRRQEGQSVRNLATAACGLGPIMTAMAAAGSLGADCGRVISHANSGDVTLGDSSRVVGYAAVSFCRASRPCSAALSSQNPDQDAPSHGLLTGEQKQALLAFARNSILQYLETETTPLFRRDDPAFMEKQGAFVTLKKHGELRGCIGNMTPDLPLYQVVSRMALSAAFHDSRFSRLSLTELKDVKIEISVLTPYRRVESVDQIRVGQDGVLLKRSGRSAVFLPQVAPEQGWTRNEMLDNLCRKAGLASDCWKQEAEFHTFQAIIFSEP
jgi:AmmeMemoRadiSam system protein B/AmmeMemoRadiSam system protein A